MFEGSYTTRISELQQGEEGILKRATWRGVLKVSEEEGQWPGSRVAQSVGDQANKDTVLGGGHPNTVGQSQIRMQRISNWAGDGRG